MAAPFERAKKTQLVFFDKPVMQVVRAICVQRQWEVRLVRTNDSAPGLADLTSPGVFTIVFTGSRELHRPLLLELANSSGALVSAVRYAFKLAGGKKGQLETLRAHFESHGCSLRGAGLMPASFLLDDPADCRAFLEYAGSRPSSSRWVLKTSHGYGGDGVAVFPNATALSGRFGSCAAVKESLVVQEYLGDPLLLEGRKFDVRALLLVAGTSPYLLFHHDGYLRVAAKNFDLADDDRAVHLTNTHVQAGAEGFSPDDHFWSFPRFQEYLDRRRPDNGDFVGSKLIPFVKKVATVLLQIGEKLEFST